MPTHNGQPGKSAMQDWLDNVQNWRDKNDHHAIQDMWDALVFSTATQPALNQVCKRLMGQALDTLGNQVTEAHFERVCIGMMEMAALNVPLPRLPMTMPDGDAM